MRSPAIVGTVLALALAAPAADAQIRLGAEVTGGLVFPLGDADDADGGTLLGGNLLVEFTPSLGVYGGYSRTEVPVSDEDVEVTLEGFEGGIRFTPGLALGPLSPTLSVGATFYEPAISGGPGEDDDAEREVGYRVGLGFDVPLGEVLTASLGGSLVSHPFGDFPQCPPSKPNCLAENTFQLTAGLRVYPPFPGGGR